MQRKITVHVCVDLITTTLCRLQLSCTLYTHMYQGLEGDGGPNPIFFLLFHLNPATSLVSKKTKNKIQNKKLTRHTIYLGLKGDNVRLVDLQKGMISQKPTYRQKNHASRAYILLNPNYSWVHIAVKYRI